MQVTEEDLKKMTPEQITELQKQNCVFCHIVSGKVPSRKVYEDEKVIAILDIHPANPGHIVLLPKEHYYIMPLVPEDYINHIFMIAKALSQAMLKALQIKGTNIFVQNGPVAGQESAHFMVHIIPRRTNDGLNLEWKPKEVPEDELSTLELQIKPFTKNIGLPEKEKEKPIEVHEEKETIDEENYLTKQLRRIP